MIYLLLHQAKNKEIEAETSWMQTGTCRMQAGETGAISLLKRNFTRIAKFRYIEKFSLVAKSLFPCVVYKRPRFWFFPSLPSQ